MSNTVELATFARTDDRTPHNHPVADMLREHITTAANRAPRSLQVSVGPSEVGEACARRLAYRLMDERRYNTTADPWASIVGTATHAWLAEAFTETNRRLGRIRFLVEQRVLVTDGLIGSCDLYDADTATVIDHKVVGATTMKEYVRNGPSSQYRIQAHCYGKGFHRLGLPVQNVAIAFYPRSGQLAGLHVWSEAFDETVADAALDRLWKITEAVDTLGVEYHAERYAFIPATPGHSCTWCPWFQPGAAVGVTCPGHMPPPSTAVTAA